MFTSFFFLICSQHTAVDETPMAREHFISELCTELVQNTFWNLSEQKLRFSTFFYHLLFPHLCQQLPFCRGNSCLIDRDNPRHLLIISWRERTNISPSARKLCCQIPPVFLTHLKKDARGRHNIIGCAKVGRPLSFEESIYGVLERWKLAPLHRGLSRCSPASPCWLWLGRVLRGCSLVLLVFTKHQVQKSLWKWTACMMGGLLGGKKSWRRNLLAVVSAG